MTVTFALVHGAWHGGWCWERLDRALGDRGHASVAVDLPCEDPGSGLEASARAVAAVLEDVDGDVVLVAHSLGGLVAPLVASLRPVRLVVHLAALVPDTGRSIIEQIRSSPEPILLIRGGRETDALGRSYWADPRTTAAILYPDLPATAAGWAFARLRPQAALPQEEPQPPAAPDVPVVSVVCAEDRVVSPDWSRRVARERLGVEPVELPTGHFPMMTHPDALADLLTGAVA